MNGEYERMRKVRKGKGEGENGNEGREERLRSEFMSVVSSAFLRRANKRDTKKKFF